MAINNIRSIVFLTGTRADFGKLKPLIGRLQQDPNFVVHIFVTGMHMLTKYGFTCNEVERTGFKNIYKFVNQHGGDGMDGALSKTITGLSDYLKEIRPDLLIIHGDRIEALAGASVGALNNILTGHIEGGEVSGTVDEMIRHAVSKLSHFHFVANQQARNRLVQLGEPEDVIHIIGSPDVDVMNSALLPSLHEVQKRYDFNFGSYGILLFHPVTSECDFLAEHIKILIDQIILSKKNYIVIYPNNDRGSDLIISEYKRLQGLSNIRVYPSMRFEYFLSLLKNADFIIGNSSAGIREAPHFGVPTINLGTRQQNRFNCDSILNIDIEPKEIVRSLEDIYLVPRKSIEIFGNGQSAELFYRIIKKPSFWNRNTQKYFIDRDVGV